MRVARTFVGVTAAAGLTAAVAAWATPASEARRVAELLDKIVQPRFLLLDGRFGMSRLRPIGGHAAARVYAETDAEKKLQADADGLGHSYQVEFASIPHAPGKDPGRSNERSALSRRSAKQEKKSVEMIYLGQHGHRLTDGPPTRQKRNMSREAMERLSKETLAKYMRVHEEKLKLVEAELPSLREGKARERTRNGWLISYRPVRATRQECLSCHAGAKPGETLGVMVYSVRLEKDPPLTQVSRGMGRPARP